MSERQGFFIFMLLLAVGLWAMAPVAEGNSEQCTVRLPAATLQIEVAATNEQRAQGLMNRTHLAENHGMLFVFPASRMVEMWMKNTLIPLDMTFIDADGVVINIAENTEPESLDEIGSTAPARYVLETGGGTTKKWGLKPGDRLNIQNCVR